MDGTDRAIFCAHVRIVGRPRNCSRYLDLGFHAVRPITTREYTAFAHLLIIRGSHVRREISSVCSVPSSERQKRHRVVYGVAGSGEVLPHRDGKVSLLRMIPTCESLCFATTKSWRNYLEATLGDSTIHFMSQAEAPSERTWGPITALRSAFGLA